MEKRKTTQLNMDLISYGCITSFYSRSQHFVRLCHVIEFPAFDTGKCQTILDAKYIQNLITLIYANYCFINISETIQF